MKLKYVDEIVKKKCPICKNRLLKYAKGCTLHLLDNIPGTDSPFDLEQRVSRCKPLYMIFCQHCGHVQLFLKEAGNTVNNEKQQ